MSRSVFLLAASAIALGACQPAEEAADALEAETPPPIAEEAAPPEAAAAATDTAEAVVEVASDAVEAEADAEDDHDHEDHAEDEDHDHDAHDHDDDEEDHDHGDEDHAHDDHDHAGGEAHVHGLSDLAASLDGSTLSVNVEGALANFDLDETLRTLDDTTPYTDNLVAIIGGDCSRDSASASIRPISDHGNLVVDLTYTCTSPDAIDAIEVTGFQTFAGFEEVNAVFLTDADQTAETLTESDTRLDLN
nr:DUF2796 domain-containing protein [Hyphomonas sp. Mor2]